MSVFTNLTSFVQILLRLYDNSTLLAAREDVSKWQSRFRPPQMRRSWGPIFLWIEKNPLMNHGPFLRQDACFPL